MIRTTVLVLACCACAPLAVAPAPAGVKPTVPASSRAEAGAESPWVERTLASMSLPEKVGQMMMPWTGGEYVAEDSPEMERLLEQVEQNAVGGFIISIGLPHSYAAKLNALQRRARVPLLIATDMESGPGMRLGGVYSLPHLLPQGGGTSFPPAMAAAASGSDSLVFQIGRAIGVEGRAVGLHLTLAPVLDVNSNPANPIINTRSFGEDPRDVARFGTAYIRGVHAGGLLAAGKHFPGHGDTHTDSHVDLPMIRVDRARLQAVELVPFAAAVRAGVDGVLVGHIAVPSVDGDRPATLSPRFTTELLRGELGFRGLVVTDAMNMGALTRRFGTDEAALQAVEAGADILLQPIDTRAAADALLRAVRSGRISEARIEASVRRILAAKASAGLHRSALVDLEQVERSVGARAHARLAHEVAERSITLVRDEPARVPLRSGKILSITYAEELNPLAGRASNAELVRSGRTVDAVRVDDRTTEAQLAALADRASDAEHVVVSAYVTPREGRGTVGTGGGFAPFVEELERRGRPVVAVSFGSPYLISAFPSVGSYVVAWSGVEVSQRSAARALVGLAPITGRLPVSIPPHHPRGTGIHRPAAAPGEVAP